MRRDGQTAAWSALQTDLQGKTGAMLKSADNAHVQLVPSCCSVLTVEYQARSLAISGQGVSINQRSTLSWVRLLSYAQPD